MGLFDRFKKKDDFSGDYPAPDFSQQPGDDPYGQPGGDPYGQDPYAQGGDPYAQQDPYGQGPYDQAQGPDSSFRHDIFSSDRPTNAENARSFARGLSGQQGGYAGAISGHESQLILERLDTIKAEIDAVKQRLMRIERFIEESEHKRKFY